ncbi:MAG: cytochrome P450 [Actinobacteria bacterium]|nr:MAG: cytochrome P450 [Actinomycetota bacterium]
MLTFDPGDPEFLDDPYPELNRLREATRVFYDEGRERWFVTRHEDVRSCLRDKRLGRNFRHVLTPEEIGVPPLDPRWSAFWGTERWSLLWLEPPDHTRIRKLVAAAFTPRSVESLREPSAELARQLLDPLAEAGEMELLYDYAQPYSIAVICRMLGVPLDRHRDLLDWSHRMVKMYEFDVPLEAAEAANRAAAEFTEYVQELIRERRAKPCDDMVTGLVEARVDGERLSDDEIVSTVIVLLNAGHEATVNTLGNGLLAFARRPDQWRRVVSGDVRAATAIEEMIRFDPPLQLFERWVLADDVVVGDVPIPRGQKIAMLFGSANRDPRVFDRPDEFDVGRENAARHIGFGGGIHVCIGAPLARSELEASVEALCRLWPDFELVEEPRRTGAFVIWGLEGLRLARG